MPTLVLDPQPAELTSLIERRRQLSQDLFDEVWEGVLHINPAPAGGHARVDQQLAELLGGLARREGLTATGPFSLGESEHDYRFQQRGLERSTVEGPFTIAQAIEDVLAVLDRLR